MAPRHLPRQACLRFWRPRPRRFGSRIRPSHFRIPGCLGLDRRAVCCIDGSADVQPRPPHPFRLVKRDASNGCGAISSFSCRRATRYYCASALRAVRDVDAARNMAGLFRPRDLFIVPLLAAPHDCGWCMVSVDGLSCLAMGGNRVLSPWTMGISYGAGQLLVAAILLFSTSPENEDEV